MKTVQGSFPPTLGEWQVKINASFLKEMEQKVYRTVATKDLRIIYKQ
jgi:hypothetical protein